MRKAFTLAEVLITLGIIGIVAAMTLPSIITKYRRAVVENRLKKFYSTINQAVRLSIAEHEEISFDTSNLENSNDFVIKWYNEYILKYMNGIKIIDNAKDSNGHTYGIKVLMNDGSGFTSFLYSANSLYLFYCIKADKSCPVNTYDGKNSFLFSYSPKENAFLSSYADKQTNINELKYHAAFGCYTGAKQYCTRLIEINGWKIPDDYPWIK
ncbi:type II secretion system protein [bacterium]|nr:type II secretion system protein [bacterium]